MKIDYNDKLCFRPLTNTYEDGESEPRGGLGSSSLPSPRYKHIKINAVITIFALKNNSSRTISTALHHEPSNPNNINQEDGTPDPAASHLMMQFGHFLGHDITLTSQEELDCCHQNIIKQGIKH